MKHIKLFENFMTNDIKLIYHGSNKKFKQFDLDKIGKGYGMSYYGYGIYFAENKSEAIKYAKWVSNKNGGKPYLYTINIKDLNFYVLDYDQEIKLPENEREIILNKLRELLDPTKIKTVRVYPVDFVYKYDDDENNNNYIEYTYDGKNGELIKDLEIENYRKNFTDINHSYTADTFYSEILTNFFKDIDKQNYSKLTSDFLISCGYDGVYYTNDVGGKGYVLFSNNVNDIQVSLIKNENVI